MYFAVVNDFKMVSFYAGLGFNTSVHFGNGA
jgi:hypothetical protein